MNKIVHAIAFSTNDEDSDNLDVLEVYASRDTAKERIQALHRKLLISYLKDANVEVREDISEEELYSVANEHLYCHWLTGIQSVICPTEELHNEMRLCAAYLIESDEVSGDD